MQRPKLPDLIPVLSRGRFITDGLFSYKVLSRHAGAVNLLDSNSDLIISLIADHNDMTDLSLLVPSLFSQSPMADKQIWNRGDFNFTGAEIWSGESIPSRRASGDWLTDIPMLSRISPEESLLSIFISCDEDLWQKKARQILSEENPEIERLIGLGRGMTPSGDDFITGILFASAISGRESLFEKTKIEERTGATTSAGKTLIHLAIRNSFPAYLLEFASEPDRERAIQKAVRHGATSGRDALAGFYWYMKRISSPRRE